jgi:serine/threonine protein phosphatase PrpC
MPNRLTIALGHHSSAGAKRENQDFHGALQPEGADLAAKGIALCIADGISASGQGAAAAETAVKSFLTDYFCTSPAWSVHNSGERVIAATNSWMHAQNRRELGPPQSEGEREQGLICTFTALVLKGRSAHLFHVGDGRIARLRDGAIEVLTEPHRVYLGGGESYLGRAMGVNRHVEIDYRQVPLAAGDLFVLSTDGVHEALSDRIVQRILVETESLEQAARAVAEAALAAGSGDNLTLQLVRIESLPDGGLDDLIGGEAALPPAPMLQPGSVFEGYEILRQLHSGSRSHVYLARHGAEGRMVALKVLSTELAQDPRALTSLLLEEWAMRRLNHPNLLGAPPQAGERRHAYAVSEHVEGQSLHGWLLDHKAPDLVPELAVVRDFVKQLAAGLHAMHRREMVHRDVRPHNVLVDGDGRLKIIDFGSVQVAGLDELAIETLDAAFAGTMQYSAPELYLGHEATPRSDLYSLGVIAYQMLTGQLPYGPRVAAARSRAEQRRLRYTPVTRHNPDVPDWMDAAIAKAVSIDPARRYAEISEFVVDLAKPNPLLASPEPVPLLQRGGVRAWQIVSAILAAMLIASLITR